MPVPLDPPSDGLAGVPPGGDEEPSGVLLLVLDVVPEGVADGLSAVPTPVVVAEVVVEAVELGVGIGGATLGADRLGIWAKGALRGSKRRCGSGVGVANALLLAGPAALVPGPPALPVAALTAPGAVGAVAADAVMMPAVPNPVAAPAVVPVAVPPPPTVAVGVVPAPAAGAPANPVAGLASASGKSLATMPAIGSAGAPAGPDPDPSEPDELPLIAPGAPPVAATS